MSNKKGGEQWLLRSEKTSFFHPLSDPFKVCQLLFHPPLFSEFGCVRKSDFHKIWVDFILREGGVCHYRLFDYLHNLSERKAETKWKHQFFFPHFEKRNKIRKGDRSVQKVEQDKDKQQWRVLNERDRLKGKIQGIKV